MIDWLGVKKIRIDQKLVELAHQKNVDFGEAIRFTISKLKKNAK